MFNPNVFVFIDDISECCGKQDAEYCLHIL